MATLSLREAVKHFDVSRPTLSRAIKTGKITGVQDGKGAWKIDPSELARVYRPRTSEPGTPLQELDDLRRRAAAAEERAAVAEGRAAVAEALAEERKGHLDRQARYLENLLARQPATEPVVPVAPSKPAGWFAWLLRR